MENATKALLIAAAVLIAIVLIALGVNLLSAGGDTADQAGQVGEELDKGIGSAAGKVEGALGSLGGTTKTIKGNEKEFADAIGLTTTIPNLLNNFILKNDTWTTKYVVAEEKKDYTDDLWNSVNAKSSFDVTNIKNYTYVGYANNGVNHIIIFIKKAS